MDFFKKNWDYIEQSVSCRAMEIAEITCRFGDIDDFRQEIYLWLVRRAPDYNAERGATTTFIAMTTATAKKRILRRLRRFKNRMIRDAVSI